jgi:hypothetical protein
MKVISAKIILAPIAALIAAVALPAAAATLVVSDTYLSAADIPAGFYAGGSPEFLEDFEDDTLNGGITASAGQIQNPGGITDSVDGDDGVINGSGTAGHSWFSSSGATGILFTFDEIVTAAGLVWTDGAGLVTFSAFDALGDLLVTTTLNIAGSGFNGQTNEDTFFGVTSAAGISSIFISNASGGIEVDHVQYGMMAAVPLPAAGLLLMAGLAGLTAMRRRRET